MSRFFETIKIENGKACNLGYHQRRYERTLARFESSTIHNLWEFIQPPRDDALYKLKLVYDAFGIIQTTYTPYTPRTINSIKLLEASLEYSYKSCDRSRIEELFSQRGTCDEILIVKNGLITDTSIANVAFFDGKMWLTPKEPLLRGTTRERLIEEGKISPAVISPKDLVHYGKMALFNAMIDFAIITIENISEDRIVVG